MLDVRLLEKTRKLVTKYKSENEKLALMKKNAMKKKIKIIIIK